MRQKASELVKGEWYCTNGLTGGTFLKFSHIQDASCFYSDQVGGIEYDSDENGMIGFHAGVHDDFIPTPEDIEKYNLNEKE